MTISSQRDTYLESRALTAPPYRLHLMLLEGAIRFGRQAADALAHGDQLTAAAPLMRVVDIVGELVVGVRQQQTDLNRQIAGVYMYLFRTASLAKINSDAAKLGEALELLEYERQTWQMLCDRLAGETAGEISSTPPPKTASPLRTLPLHAPSTTTGAPGLSLEA